MQNFIDFNRKQIKSKRLEMEMLLQNIDNIDNGIEDKIAHCLKNNKHDECKVNSAHAINVNGQCIFDSSNSNCD